MAKARSSASFLSPDISASRAAQNSYISLSVLRLRRVPLPVSSFISASMRSAFSPLTSPEVENIFLKASSRGAAAAALSRLWRVHFSGA